MSRRIFVTGFLRSGTTLLEKILHNHDSVCIGSQPFPNVFYKIKDAFYRERGISGDRYPLGHLFIEKRYSREDFASFLDRHVITKDELAAAFRDMEAYSGQLVPELLDYRERVDEGPFIEVYSQLTGFLGEIYSKGDATYSGSKEVYCEEFVPHFLRHDSKVFIIIRDPRDVLASMNFGKGSEYTGKAFPALYVLRKWRKSVAYALAYGGHKDFLCVRYEDLAADTWSELDRLTGFLGIEPFPKDRFKDGIIDQHGKTWKGNSSFGAYRFISTDSIGTFRDRLDEDTIRYAESVCYPEMRALGYEIHACRDGFDEGAVRRYSDPSGSARGNFPADYSSSDDHVEQETRRYRLLQEGILEPDEARAWFILPEAYERLREAAA